MSAWTRLVPVTRRMLVVGTVLVDEWVLVMEAGGFDVQS
jgi:hypothetical protein